MIEVRNVYKEFSGHYVLNDICAEFEPGKTNLTIGQSGSGKTVLLKCIAGLHSVSKGDIFYNGRSFSVMNEKQRKEIVITISIGRVVFRKIKSLSPNY